MSRKSVWDTDRSASENPSWDKMKETAPGNAAGSPPISNLIAQLKIEAPRKRTRNWDHTHAPMVASYRGIPREIHTALGSIAEELSVTTGDVARAFLEYGLVCVRRGSIRLHSYPKGAHMTLYPPGSKILGWKETRVAGPEQGIGKKKKRSGQEPAWRAVVSFRGIPEEVQEAVRTLAVEYAVGVGETAAVLLEYGLQAYQEGRLRLDATPKSGSSISWEPE